MIQTTRTLVLFACCVTAVGQEPTPQPAPELATARAASESQPEDAERAWDLALSAWRAGDAELAESAAERAATLSDGGLAPLRDGLIGNLRFEAALAAREETPAEALELAQAARDRYLRALRQDPGRAPLIRNLERAVRLVEELEQQQDDQQQQDQQQDDGQQQDQQQDDQQQQQDDQQQQQDPSQDPADAPPQGEPEPEPGEGQEPPPEPQPDSSPQDEPQPDGAEPPPEGESSPEPEPEPKPSEGEPSPDDPASAGAAPPAREGEPSELSPEQQQRLLDALERLEQQREELRRAARDQRSRARRDW